MKRNKFLEKSLFGIFAGLSFSSLSKSKIKRIQAAKEAIDIDLSHEDWYVMLEAAVGHEVP